MTAESLTTKLARERLSAIKRFIPLRDRVRDKLQQRQESQIDFSESNYRKFKKDVFNYRSYKAGVDSYNLRRQQQKSGTPKRTPRRQQAKKISFSPDVGASSDPPADKSSSGSGYSNRNSKSFNSKVTCPGNILSDISRLEVLVGGARAGNNSMEIINEASDICRRLFQGGIMDIRTYRELIDELAEIHRQLWVLQRLKTLLFYSKSFKSYGFPNRKLL
ncbi:hypothetical protein ACJMK2_007059 [Sinanodonta woodiana]|uniref:Uncharacterized protein n=1 Tax=Sinanodonta woodiana TaxID=1069815 RepID=A0ABD3VKF6_SINWO